MQFQHRETRFERFSTGLLYAVMALLCVMVIVPFLNVIAVSFSGKRAVLSGQVTLWPMDITLDAYRTVFSSPFFFRAYGNTLFVVIAGTVISILMTTLAAFCISRRDLPGGKAITFLMTLTMWFSGGMIPTFLLVRNLGLYDSLPALFLPSLISAYNAVIVRNFFLALPVELEESAALDGANDVTILFRIFLPLSLPVLSTVTLWIAVGYWNAYTPALLYLSTREKFTLQLVLRDIIFTNTMKQYMDIGDTSEIISESIKYANIIMTMLPIMLVYPFLQKYFVKGVMLGAVKG